MTLESRLLHGSLKEQCVAAKSYRSEAWKPILRVDIGQFPGFGQNMRNFFLSFPAKRLTEVSDQPCQAQSDRRSVCLAFAQKICTTVHPCILIIVCLEGLIKFGEFLIIRTLRGIPEFCDAAELSLHPRDRVDCLRGCCWHLLSFACL
ncbi:hypothetical protein PoB_004976800 [Plakobranchus ocellatus]|uniref:Uncharacterized protein n=1 Tax=Plakobranchus ocellatus TaxID=259542 RepID=A0AAV4BWS8_9GAST|nr:hypothetical protein PoB_004976800 [Plakobranchus ocellatus]